MPTRNTFFTLFVLVDVLSLGYSDPICPQNQIYHSDFYGHRPGRCCVYASCQPQFYVRECDVNGGRDLCVPCPPDSYLDDPTDSETVHGCIKKNCAEDTVPIDYPATKYDSSACAKRCACDTSRGYCGTDPCRCQSLTCLTGEILLQNCTCVSTTPSHLLTPSSSIAQGKDKASTASPENSPTSPGTPKKTRKTTMKPEKEDSSEKEPESSWRVWTVTAVIIFPIVFGGVVLTVVWYRRPRTTVVNYSTVENNNTVHNYHDCNIQQGNKNTMTVLKVSEEEEEEDSDVSV